MSLPVSSDYLSIALVKVHAFPDMTLRQQRIGDIHLPTGQLVACDPLVFDEPSPFEILLPRGAFPVILSVAHYATDQRVAFATIRFSESAPVAWEMLTHEGQDTATLEDGYFFGYGVDSGTGCFIDASAAKALDIKMGENPDFYEEIIAAMDRTYVHTWSWLNMPMGDGNLIAFSTGFGDGSYASYRGLDAEGGICAVVTDFSVVRSEDLP